MALVTFGALVVAVGITWPLLSNLTTTIPGGGPGIDPTGYLVDLWYSATHGYHLWGAGVQPEVQAPFGHPTTYAVNANQAATGIPAWAIARLWGPIPAMNIVILISLALSSTAMYALVRWLGQQRIVAAWAALAFMILPYHLFRAEVHYPLAFLPCLPLLVLASLAWWERSTPRRGVWVAASLLLAWLTHPYYGVLCSALVLTLGAAFVVRRLGTRRGLLPTAAACAGLVSAVLALVAIPLILLRRSTTGGYEAFVRQPFELTLYGARIRDYLVPDPASSLMRTLMGDRWTAYASPGEERIAYVGWSIIVLAVVGITLSVARRTAPRTRSLIPVGLALGGSAFLLSLASPYSVGSHAITMPSTLLFRLMPQIRSTGRFSIAVATIAIAIGAVGLGALLTRLDNRPWIHVGLIAFATLLILIELPNGLPLRSDVPIRPGGAAPDDVETWRWLREHRDGGIVFEVPTLREAAGEVADRAALYGQVVHGHPIANGGVNEPTPGARFARYEGDPRVPGAAARYASLGIRYVVLDDWRLRLAGDARSAAAPPPAGFTTVATFAGAAIWRVTAKPAPAVVVFDGVDWWGPEPSTGGRAQWLRTEGRITVWAHEEGPAQIKVSLSSAGGIPRRVRVSGPGTDTTLSVGQTRTLSLEVELSRGVNVFALQNLGPPAVAAGPNDPRVISLLVGPVTLTKGRG